MTQKMDVNAQLQYDHKVIDGARATRRYFSKFERIIGHMGDVAALSYKEKLLSPLEARVVLQYLQGLAHTFTALSYKFLMANRVGDHSAKLLSIDKTDSGFPVFQEILQMAADALQADDHLLTLPSQGRLKKDMMSICPGPICSCRKTIRRRSGKATSKRKARNNISFTGPFMTAPQMSRPSI